MRLEQQWRDFICSPSGIGRHLSAIGKTGSTGAAPPIEDDALQSFLAKLRNRDASTELLATAIDLYRPQYRQFCQIELPPLLDALANERVGELSVDGPALRGQPRWAATVLARRTARIPSTSYISSVPKRSFDLPENMLVRWLVGSLVHAADRIEKLIGSRFMPESVRYVQAACRSAMDHHWFGQVDMPPVPSADMLAAARRQRHRGYRIASALASERLPREVKSKTSRWLALLDLLRVNWLEPVDPEELFELYALALVLEVLKDELNLGEPSELGLVMPGRRHVAKFSAGEDSKVFVYFDQSPASLFGLSSRYQDILDAHDPRMGSRRRPDITIVRRPEHGDPTVALVEVKDTTDPSYTADSIYKAFGYIHDFKDLWPTSSSNPKVVLLFPETVRLKATVEPSSVDVALVSSLDRAALARCLKSGLFGHPLLNVGKT